jgi:hypothetical protein
MAFNWFGRPALVMLLCLTGVATAKAGIHVTAEQRAACTPDAMRLCSSEIPDIGRVTACMKANQANLSQRCRATFAHAGTGERLSPHHQHGRARVVLAYGIHHHPLPHYRRAHFNQGIRVAGQIFMGLKQACENQTVPAEVCGYQRMIPVELLGSMAPLLSGY